MSYKLNFLKKLGIGSSAKFHSSNSKTGISFQERPFLPNRSSHYDTPLSQRNDPFLFTLQEELQHSIDHLHRLESLLNQAFAIKTKSSQSKTDNDHTDIQNELVSSKSSVQEDEDNIQIALKTPQQD